MGSCFAEVGRSTPRAQMGLQNRIVLTQILLSVAGRVVVEDELSRATLLLNGSRGVGGVCRATQTGRLAVELFDMEEDEEEEDDDDDDDEEQ